MHLLIACDVGGTQIKAGVLSETGTLAGGLHYFDARANESKVFLLDHFMDIFRRMAALVPAGAQISGLGMAFPGDFDYENGISLIQGLDKYGALYRVNLKQELGERIRRAPELHEKCAPDFQLLFLHDIAAFLLGKIREGIPHGTERVMALCIGTGAGSSFADRGRIVGAEVPGVPERGWIYNTPFRESILDDYISVRGLARITGDYFSVPADGKMLFELAEAGNAGAKEVFARFGADIAAAVLPFLSGFRPRVLLLGGQIAKSFCYFGGPLRLTCDRLGIEIQIAYDTSESAVYGLFEEFSRRKSEK